MVVIAGEEYCWEMFNASCPGEEVIFMQSAKYGRMRLGECLMRDYYVGCAADVLTYLDAICSGRHVCQLDIPDNTLQKMQPCPKDLIAYLEATYTCIKGKLFVTIPNTLFVLFFVCKEIRGFKKEESALVMQDLKRTCSLVVCLPYLWDKCTRTRDPSTISEIKLIIA